MSLYQTETFPVGSFQCNCTLVMNTETKQVIVVDPGDETESILERIDHHGLTVRALWHTHAHLDHVGATRFLYDLCSQRNRDSGALAPVVYLHDGDRWLYENVAVQAKMLGLRPFEVTTSFEKINDGQKYDGFAGIRAIHTPGHTPGSCCLEVKDVGEIDVPRQFEQNSETSTRVLLSGDTLFRRSIGRTDLWGGDSAKILASIRAKLFGLPPDTVVIPGHGPLTSISEEKEKNPFF